MGLLASILPSFLPFILVFIRALVDLPLLQHDLRLAKELQIVILPC